MITITNGKHTTEVSRGSFEAMFKKLGYSEVKKAPIVEKNNKGNQEPKPAKK